MHDCTHIALVQGVWFVSMWMMKCFCAWQEVYEWNMAATTYCHIGIISRVITLLLDLFHQYIMDINGRTTTAERPYLGQDSCSLNLTSKQFEKSSLHLAHVINSGSFLLLMGQSGWFSPNPSPPGSSFCSNWSLPRKLYWRNRSLFRNIV